MRNYLITILLIIMLLFSFAITACKNQYLETEKPKQESLEQSAVATTLIEESSTETKFKDITVDEAYQIFTGDINYIFIDVRSENEYNTIHIKKAVNIPVLEIENRLNEIPKDKIIIVYCDGSGCSRSSNAANILVESGYNHVHNLIGNGIHEWVEKGYPKVENIS